MTRVLITAFEPYGKWRANASWLALVELTRQLPETPRITTRLYPVDFAAVRRRLETDLAHGYDFAIHMGQAPGSTAIRLEAIAVNVQGDSTGTPGDFPPLATDGPVAYRSDLPLAAWATTVRELGVPAQISHHSGVFVCNATLYWNRYLCERNGWKTRATLVHLPLATSQTIDSDTDLPSLPVSHAVSALNRILQELR